MDLARLTDRSREALTEAQSLATRLGHTEVDVEHLLASLLNQDGGLLSRLFARIGIDSGRLRADLDEDLRRRARVSGPGVAPGQIRVTQRLSQLIDAADGEAKRLNDDYVSVEHLALAMISEEGQTGTPRILRQHGIDQLR